MTAPEVRLDGITTVLDDTPVLSGLRLTLAPGEITVLMGASGAGKTTLVRHLAGLVPPDDGTIRIDDVDVWSGEDAKVLEARRAMSVMLGGSSLFDTSIFASMTVLENLTYSLDPRGLPSGFSRPSMHPGPSDELRERAMVQLAELNLTGVAEMKPAALPAHARKRLALARALVVGAPLVVLDEVDIGLDAAHRDLIRATLLGYHARTGATMLVATHSISLAKALDGSLAVLNNGRIVAHGSAAELLAGVDSPDEFDHRFQFMRFMGPLQPADVAPPPARKPLRTVLIDQRVIFLGLIGLLLVALFVAVTTIAPPPGLR